VLLLTLLLGPIGYLASLGWWARNAAPKVAPAQE
jgi:hypothetical protein